MACLVVGMEYITPVSQVPIIFDSTEGSETSSGQFGSRRKLFHVACRIKRTLFSPVLSGGVGLV